MCPGRTSASAYSASAVSSPMIPKGADSKSSAFSSGACGAWSVASTVIVPSTTPATTASTSSALRNGGFIFASVLNPSHASSVSSRWWGEASAVMSSPWTSRAARTISTDPAADRCCTWYRQPAAAASRTSRSIMISSAIAGHPVSPSRADVGPLFITLPRVSVTSWQCCIITLPVRAIARRPASITAADSTTSPSSENATAPRSLISPISHSRSP